MDPIVALAITITGCVILVGFITLLAFRFAKINKILKEHGEKLFGRKK